MNDTPYTPPVDQLLTLGKPELAAWTDYLELGISPEHIPELIRMATDEELINAYSDTIEVWAPLHAIRALGQLHAEIAAFPLLPLFDDPDDEWIVEDLAKVYAMIGPSAIPALASYVNDDSHDVYSRGYASNGLAEIGKSHPESRADAIAVITQLLEQFEENDPELNGMLIGDLSELKATETLPLIERAFEADSVDEFFIDLDWVLEEFGLKEREPLEIPDFGNLFSSMPALQDAPSYEDIPSVPAYPEPSTFAARASYAQSLPTPTKFSRNKKKKAKKPKAHKKR